MSVGSNGKADNNRSHNDREDWVKTPKGTEVSGGLSPDTTFHHLIPYNNIWPTWNKLLRSAAGMDQEDDAKTWETIDWQNNSVASAFACLKAWVTLLGYPDPDDLTTRLVEARAGGEKLAEKDCEWLGINLLWTGWNIVEGPLRTIREDDPDEKYDDFEGPLRLAGHTDQASVAHDVKDLNAAFLVFRASRKELKGVAMQRNADMAVDEEDRGQGIQKRMRAYPVKLPKFRDDYDEAFRQVALALDRVERAVLHTGCGPKKPLTSIDLNMWIKLDPPRRQGLPWITGTMENRMTQVGQSMRKGFGNIQAIMASTGYKPQVGVGM